MELREKCRKLLADCNAKYAWSYKWCFEQSIDHQDGDDSLGLVYHVDSENT